MSSNSFGKLLTVTTFGESHGPAIGCVVDGCPPGLAIAPEEFRTDLDRRATGRSRYTSQRHEADDIEILSGVYEGCTTGTPIALLIRNTDQRSKDYGDIAQNAGQDLHLVRFAPLCGETRLAGLALIEIDLDLGLFERDARRATINDAADRRTVAFAEGRHTEKMAEGVV